MSRAEPTGDVGGRLPGLLARGARSPLAQALGLLLLFVALSFGVRFGNGAQFSTASYAGNLAEDAGQFIWHFLHFKKVATGEADFFFSDRVFYPVGLQMVRQDWAPTAGLLALPFQFFLGPLGALNAEVLLAFALCGFTATLLAFHLCRDRLLALMVGVVFAFCEFRVDKSLGHINQANQQFIPLYLLWMLRYYQSGRWRYALGAAVCFYLATFCTYYQLVFVVLITLFFWIYRAAGPLWRAGRDPRRWPAALSPFGRRTAGFVAVGALSCLPLFAPLLLGAWEGFTQAARSLTYTMPAYSADLLSYVKSNLYTPPAERLFSGEGGTAFMGYGPLALFGLSLLLLRRRTGAGPWVFLALVFFVISLGSTLVVAGQPICPLPVFPLLQALPVVAGAKVAARFASLTLLFASLAGAVTFAWILRSGLPRWSPGSRAGLRLAVVAVVCAEALIPPARFTARALPVPYDPPPVYRAIAGIKEDVALLQFPPVWDAFTGNIGPHRFPRQWFAHQTVHGKPIVSGIGNMVPAATLTYLTRLPFLRQMIALGKGEALDPATEKPEHARDASTVVRTLDLRLILVYKKLTVPGGELFEENHAAAARYLQKTLPVSRIHDDAQLTLYAVRPQRRPAAGDKGRRITFDEEGSLVYLGGGFRRVRRPAEGWLAEVPLDLGEPLELFVDLPGQGPRGALVLEGRCSAPPCAFAVQLNGRPVGEVTLPGTWQRRALGLPERFVRPGLNRFYLRPGGGSHHPAVPVGRTGVRSPAQLRLISAGVEVGDRASVRLGQRELVPNTRGYNIAVLTPDGEPLAAAAFDLVADSGGRQAARLVQFLDAVAPGNLVCVAVRDDGSIGLTDAVVRALRKVGAGSSLSGKLRHSYALIGVQGAAPGTALEQVAEAAPVVLELGRVLQLRALELRAGREVAP